MVLESGMIVAPPNVKMHPDLRLFTWHPHGVVNSDILSKVLAFLEFEEQESKEPFNRFCDLSRVTVIEVDLEYVVRASMHRRRLFAGQQPVRSAFLTTTPEATRLAKVHATLTANTPLHVAVFSELAEAADWLGIPQELLQP